MGKTEIRGFFGKKENRATTAPWYSFLKAENTPRSDP
jgi:hypothetical protein